MLEDEPKEKDKPKEADQPNEEDETKPDEPPCPGPHIHEHIVVPVAASAVPAGLCSFQMRAAGKSFCFVCSLAIPKNTARFDYKIKAYSTSLRHVKRVHSGCLGRLAAETLDHDVAKLQEWADDHSDQTDVQAMPHGALASRGGAPSASASGSGGVGG